jgi:hypothetical protein
MAQSNIILLNEGLYSFPLPAMPPERDIWYSDLPKSQQFWKTPHAKKFKWLNPDGTIKDVKRMALRERVEYIEYWDDKWWNGLWFFNNGEPTHITGAHVDHIVFNKFRGKFLWYMDGQRLRFYFRELSNNEPLCDGRAWVKPRRAGLTTEQITEDIRASLEDTYNRIALQSTKDEVCLRTLMKPIIDTYCGRPEWMRAEFYLSNGKKPQKSLKLESNVLKADYEVMNSLIQAFPTEPSAVDGDGWIRITMDEFSKWTACSPRETLDVNLKAIVNPGKSGKIDCLSTTGDKEAAAKAIAEWHTLIAESDPRQKMENGKTKSGLWKYFVEITASHYVIEEVDKYLHYKGFDLKSCRDVYGHVNKEIVEEWVWKEHNKYPKNSQQYIYSLYRLPLEESHALLASAKAKQIFPYLRITNRLSYLESVPVDKKPYVRGDLIEDAKGKVWFEENPYGVWLIATHPHFSAEDNIDTRNRWRFRNGIYFPPTNPEYVGGYDPTRYKTKNTTSNNLSESCGVFWKKFDYFGSGVYNEYCALMLYRPEDPNDAHVEMVKGCKYFGAPLMAERQVESTEYVFIERGMDNFLMKGKDKIWGTWTTPKIIENGVQKLATKFSTPKSEMDVDQIDIYPFEAGLRDFKSFDINNTLSSHVTMASIMCELGADQLLQTNTTDNSVQRMLKAAQSVFPPVNR